VCANRILVQDGVYDAFTKRLAETAGAMKVADGFEPGRGDRPLIDMKAVEKVEAHIADALKKGAKVVTGGKCAQLLRAGRADRCDDANFFAGGAASSHELDTTGCEIWILCGVGRGSREPQES